MKTIVGTSKSYVINQNDCFWSMITRLEDKRYALDITDIQNKCGVYIFWDFNNKPIRIGIATKLRNRIMSYDTQQKNWYVFEDMYMHISFVSVIYTKTQIEAQTTEKDLLRTHKPRFNFRHLDCYESRPI